MKSLLVYTLLRVLLLIAVGGFAYAAGMRGYLLLIVAFLGSGVISYFVLDGPRGRFAGSVGGYFRRLNQRIDAAAAAEDDELPQPVTSPSTSAAPGTPGSPRSS